jgi:hypothetical protein
MCSSELNTLSIKGSGVKLKKGIVVGDRPDEGRSLSTLVGSQGQGAAGVGNPVLGSPSTLGAILGRQPSPPHYRNPSANFELPAEPFIRRLDFSLSRDCKSDPRLQFF